MVIVFFTPDVYSRASSKKEASRFWPPRCASHIHYVLVSSVQRFVFKRYDRCLAKPVDI